MRTEKRPLTKAVVQAAIAGDREAIDTVLDYYADDIDALCVRTSRKRNGVLNQIKHMFIRDLPNLKLDKLFP